MKRAIQRISTCLFLAIISISLSSCAAYIDYLDGKWGGDTGITYSDYVKGNWNGVKRGFKKMGENAAQNSSRGRSSSYCSGCNGQGAFQHSDGSIAPCGRCGGSGLNRN